MDAKQKNQFGFVSTFISFEMKNSIFISVLFVLLLVLLGCAKTSDSYYNEAVISVRNGNFDRAQQELEKAANLNPPSVKVYYGLGIVYIYQGLLDEAVVAFNKAVDSDSNYQITIDPNTFEILKQANMHSDWQISPNLTLKRQDIFTPDGIMRKSFGIRTIKYLWRCINYKRIADHITKDCSTDEEKIFALFDWTYRNISVVPTARGIFAALPLDIMRRGYGVCDRSAWTFATLAWYAGRYMEDIFILKNPETGDSPHTVAIIFLNGKWVTGAIYHLARSYEALGLYQKALDEYKKIETLANVQQRIKDIDLSKGTRK